MVRVALLRIGRNKKILFKYETTDCDEIDATIIPGSNELFCHFYHCNILMESGSSIFKDMVTSDYGTLVIEEKYLRDSVQWEFNNKNEYSENVNNMKLAFELL